MSEKDKNWKPPTLDSSIEYMEYEISKNPFGIPSFEGFILQSLKELKEKDQLIAQLREKVEGLAGFRTKPWGEERVDDSKESGDFLHRSELLSLLDELEK